MKITDIRATTVTVPLEAPLRHANGCHRGRFVRTVVEVETDAAGDNFLEKIALPA
jgi:glucarate dehydratase